MCAELIVSKSTHFSLRVLKIQLWVLNYVIFFHLAAPPVINYYNGFEIAVIAGMSLVPGTVDPCSSKGSGYKNIHVS